METPHLDLIHATGYKHPRLRLLEEWQILSPNLIYSYGLQSIEYEYIAYIT
jgi:hypothetical protein